MKIKSFETAFRWWVSNRYQEGQTLVCHTKEELPEAFLSASQELKNLKEKLKNFDFKITEYFFEDNCLKIFWKRNFSELEKENVKISKKKYKTESLESEKRDIKKRAKKLGLL